MGLLGSHPMVKLLIDLMIFGMFISSIYLYSWSYAEGFKYCQSYYSSHCLLCIFPNKTNITGGYPSQANETFWDAIRKGK